MNVVLFETITDGDKRYNASGKARLVALQIAGDRGDRQVGLYTIGHAKPSLAFKVGLAPSSSGALSKSRRVV